MEKTKKSKSNNNSLFGGFFLFKNTLGKNLRKS